MFRRLNIIENQLRTTKIVKFCKIKKCYLFYHEQNDSQLKTLSKLIMYNNTQYKYLKIFQNQCFS